MSKRQWLMILGALIIALPFLGFPSSLDTVIYIIVGIIIIAISYRLNSGKVMKEEEKSPAMPYVEHKSNNP
ncbi:MAG: hypothetical protein AAB629_02285 [Patescibacteria group bacterium]